jgi:hypothetical protein
VGGTSFLLLSNFWGSEVLKFGAQVHWCTSVLFIQCSDTGLYDPLKTPRHSLAQSEGLALQSPYPLTLWGEGTCYPTFRRL